MKTITTIFESILGDNKDLVWSPEDMEGVYVSATWGWGG